MNTYNGRMLGRVLFGMLWLWYYYDVIRNMFVIILFDSIKMFVCLFSVLC